jgi:hypothetical protein
LKFSFSLQAWKPFRSPSADLQQIHPQSEDEEKRNAVTQIPVERRFDGVRNECQKFQLGIPQPELRDGSLPVPMHLFMECSAEGDQVRFGVIPAMAAKFLMMHL